MITVDKRMVRVGGGSSDGITVVRTGPKFRERKYSCIYTVSVPNTRSCHLKVSERKEKVIAWKGDDTIFHYIFMYSDCQIYVISTIEPLSLQTTNREESPIRTYLSLS